MPGHRLLLSAAGLVVVAAAGLASAAPAWAATTAATTTTGAPSTTTSPTTGAALLKASQAAAKAATSVHFLAKTKLGSKTITLTASASATTGTQKIVLRGGSVVGHMSARLVNQIVYFKGDANGLEGYLGMPSTLAAKYSEHWIFFSPATKDYATFKKSLTLTAALRQVDLTGPYTTAAATTNGQSAEKISGTTKSLSSKGNKGKAALYVATSGTPLPIRYVATGKQKKQRETGTVVFSKWGAPVAPASPQTATSASSIVSGG